MIHLLKFTRLRVSYFVQRIRKKKEGNLSLCGHFAPSRAAGVCSGRVLALGELCNRQ